MDSADYVALDQSIHLLEDGYDLIRIFRMHDSYTVRVRVRRRDSPEGSIAVAEVLSALLTWTEVVNSPAAEWYSASPPRTSTPDTVLVPVMSELLQRSSLILSGFQSSPPRL